MEPLDIVENCSRILVEVMWEFKVVRWGGDGRRRVAHGHSYSKLLQYHHLRNGDDKMDGCQGRVVERKGVRGVSFFSANSVSLGPEYVKSTPRVVAVAFKTERNMKLRVMSFC